MFSLGGTYSIFSSAHSASMLPFVPCLMLNEAKYYKRFLLSFDIRKGEETLTNNGAALRWVPFMRFEKAATLQSDIIMWVGV